MEIDILRPDEERLWDAYVRSNPRGTLYHLTAWRRAIDRAYGLQSRFLVARVAGEIAGVLPVYFQHGLLGGRKAVSVPYAPYGGVCASEEDVARGLLDAARRIQVERGSRYLELRHASSWPFIETDDAGYVTYILDLPSDPEELWKGFGPKVRNQTRKAQKAGLECLLGTEHLDEFYGVYAEHMRDLGSPAHGRDFFAAVANEYAGDVEVFVVRHQGRAVGGMVAVAFEGVMNDLWACSLRRYFDSCPNNLLYWSALEHCCQRGFARFDFGRSTDISGTARFKAQWNAQPLPLQYCRWERFVANPVAYARDDEKLQMASRLWRRMPLWVTRLMGPGIRKRVA